MPHLSLCSLLSPRVTRPPPVAPMDPDALALFERMTVPPDEARKIAINDCIVALKAAGVWPLLDRLYVLAAHDEQAALLDWKAATAMPIVTGVVAFQIDRGFTGNGTDGRIQTRFNPTSNGVNYKQDDASLWCWNRTASLSSVADLGSITAPLAAISVMDGNGDMAIALNDATTGTVGSPSPVGFAGASRADAGSKRAWRNGVGLGSAMASASTGIPDAEQWICAANNSSFSTRQIAAAAWGASLAGKEMAFYNAMEAYMTAVGAFLDDEPAAT